MKTNTVSLAPTQMLIELENASFAKDLKKAIGMMKRVTKVTLPKRTKLTHYEQSMRDLAEGRVYKYESLDDLKKEIEG